MNPATHRFILTHAAADPAALLLRKNIPPEVDVKLAVQQIDGRQRAREKLPALAACPDFIFPPKLAMEQCSSEHTARYKAPLFAGLSVADITGGLGVDAFYVAQRAAGVTYVERNAGLCALAQRNFSALGASNIFPHCGDGIHFLQRTPQHFDAIYLDPARRDGCRNRVVRLAGCEPNVVEWQSLLLRKATFFALKASPMLDITQALRELPQVAQVHVVAVQNECKELLFICRKGSTSGSGTTVHCADVRREGVVRFEFALAEREAEQPQRFATLKRYLYEPNASILKAGAFRLVGARFGVGKLHPHTHLYTSDVLQAEFPGRIFEVQEVFSPGETGLKKRLSSMQANVAARNFPLTVAEIRRRYNVKEGGDAWIYAATLCDGKKRLIKVQKIAEK